MKGFLVNNGVLRLLTAVSAGSAFFGVYFISPVVFRWLVLGIVWVIFMREWPRITGLKPDSLRAFFASFIYPLAPGAVLGLYIRQVIPDGFWLVMYPFYAAWVVDTAAYIVGTFWGSHYCFPRISPRKTWEGLIAGIVASVVLHAALRAWVLPGSWVMMIVRALIIAGASIGGDLWISWLKRQAHIKDTGSILPGHGGLLDRFDSVLFVGVISFLWRAW